MHLIIKIIITTFLREKKVYQAIIGFKDSSIIRQRSLNVRLVLSKPKPSKNAGRADA
jgi:hypothetical protein